MNKEFIKLAYMTGYKQAQEAVRTAVKTLGPANFAGSSLAAQLEDEDTADLRGLASTINKAIRKDGGEGRLLMSFDDDNGKLREWTLEADSPDTWKSSDEWKLIGAAAAAMKKRKLKNLLLQVGRLGDERYVYKGWSGDSVSPDSIDDSGKPLGRMYFNLPRSHIKSAYQLGYHQGRIQKRADVADAKKDVEKPERTDVADAKKDAKKPDESIADTKKTRKQRLVDILIRLGLAGRPSISPTNLASHLSDQTALQNHMQLMEMHNQAVQLHNHLANMAYIPMTVPMMF